MGDGILRVGMIGAGAVGQLAHLAHYAALPGVAVTALADLRPNLLAQVGRRWQVPALYPDHQALLANADIDAVIIVVHRPAAGPITRDALRAGKAVLTEKPMAHSVAQADALLAEARAPYAVGMMKRFDPGVMLARTLLQNWRDDGRHGALLGLRGWCRGGPARTNFDDHAMTAEPRPAGLELWAVAPDWLPADQASAYADFLNVHIHDLNLLRWLAPDEPQLTAVTWRSDQDLTMRFDCGGIPAEFVCSRDDPPVWTEGIEVAFERAMLRIDLPPPLHPGTVARLSVDGLPVTVPPGWAFQAQAAAFADWLRGGPPPPTTAEACRQDLVLAEALWRWHPSMTAHAPSAPPLAWPPQRPATAGGCGHAH